jgi:hypothetical protein
MVISNVLDDIRLKQEMQSRTALRGQLAVACLIYYMYSIVLNRTAPYKSFSIAL